MEDYTTEYFRYKNRTNKSPAVDMKNEEARTIAMNSILDEIQTKILMKIKLSEIDDKDLLMQQYEIAGIIRDRLNYLIMSSPDKITKNEVALYKVAIDAYSKLYEQIKGKKISSIVTYKNWKSEDDPELKEAEIALRSYSDVVKEKEKLKKRIEELEHVDVR